jgi:hypothetical protein
MKVNVNSQYVYRNELRSGADRWSVPLSIEDVTPGLGQLVEEVYMQGVLAESLPWESDHIDVEIEPEWLAEPAVDKVKVTLSVGTNGRSSTLCQSFDRGPWVRSAEHAVLRLRAEGKVAEKENVYRQLVATKASGAAADQVMIPPLAPPPIVDQSLEDLGVRRLGDGSLAPDRPVLVNQRLVDDAVAQCEASGAVETGGTVLGEIIRLPEPMPNTRTRVVTVLCAVLADARHTGDLTCFHISPEALLEGARIAALRGKRESVLSIMHTHGWGCGDCNQKACLLAECTPSLQDYELESLFPTKALLLPIAGRKLGAPGRRPVLQIHGWRGGELRPVRWQAYFD